MNAEIFAEWFRRQGYQVARTESSYWVNLGRRVYQAFPYHWLIQPEEAELQEFIQSQQALALRYSTLLEAPEGCFSYHAVLGESAYDLGSFGKKARYDLRQGLKNCTIQKISFERLAEEGWLLQKDTMERQERQDSMSIGTWRSLCLATGGLPGFEAWGALIEGQLGASAITFQLSDWVYILFQQSHRKYLPIKLNNALSFIVMKEMISRPLVRKIFYGLHSLDAPASVDQFKFRMCYVAKPVRQRVVFHPWIKPCINRVSHTVVRNLLKLTPGNPTLAKAEGMMRFYLEGLRPLEDQNCPEILRKLDWKTISRTTGPGEET
ncbi:MAG: hypothetical protein ACLPT6_10785 [Desulfobaccales bacterium]